MRFLIFVLFISFLAPTLSLAKDQHVALIVGASNYEYGVDLPNASNDATAVARRFQELGYATQLLLDPDRAEMLRALALLRLNAADASQVVIYFSGHGVTIGGESYLILRDTPMLSQHLNSHALPLRVLVRAVSDKPRQKIILLDACRESPLAEEGPFSPPSKQAAPAGLFIAYAAQPGQVAYDGGRGLSPFTAALLEALAEHPRPVEQVLRSVRLRVIQQTAGQQIPWTQSSLLSSAVLGLAPQSARLPE